MCNYFTNCLELLNRQTEKQLVYLSTKGQQALPTMFTKNADPKAILGDGSNQHIQRDPTMTLSVTGARSSILTLTPLIKDLERVKRRMHCLDYSRTWKHVICRAGSPFSLSTANTDETTWGEYISLGGRMNNSTRWCGDSRGLVS